MPNAEIFFLKSNKLFLPVENAIRGSCSGFFKPHYFQRNGNRVILSVHANYFYGWCLSHYLPHGG